MALPDDDDDAASGGVFEVIVEVSLSITFEFRASFGSLRLF